MYAQIVQLYTNCSPKLFRCISIPSKWYWVSSGVFGYYLGGMVTEGRFLVGESRDLGDLPRSGGWRGVMAATIGLFSGQKGLFILTSLDFLTFAHWYKVSKISGVIPTLLGFSLE